MNKLIVITGCSGGGKSTLISELHNLGYTVFNEVGRKIVQEQMTINGDITPWQNPQVFCETSIRRSISAFEEAKKMTNVLKQIIFFDRSFLDGISYYQTLKTNDSHKYDYLINELRYYPTIFMTPPWKEIFSQDEERRHTLDDAIQEYKRLLKFYPKYGYSIVELPKVSVNERIEFLLSSVVS